MLEYFIMIDSPFEKCISAMVEADGETVCIFNSITEADKPQMIIASAKLTGLRSFNVVQV